MRLLSSLVALAALAACTPAATRDLPAPESGTTIVVLVRHAEKAAEPAADPPLTAAGVVRAEALVEAVRGMRVAAVLSTDFARTRSTAAPLAARLGLTTQIVDARARDHARLVAGDILAKHRGRTVVVVGHSNTVPDIVAALGAARPPAICDGEYDNLYVVRVPVAGAATVERRRYGAPTRQETGCGGMR